MKHNGFFFMAAAFMMAACTIVDPEQVPGENSGKDVRTVTFSAMADGAPGSRVVIDNSGSKPVNVWENGDEITVYSGQGASASMEGYKFSTSLSANSAEADFEYTGSDWTDGTTGYMAIYPAATAARTVNFTGDGEIYKMAAVDIPQNQTLVAGSFDRSAMVATAYSTNSTLAFKNAVALIKFRVNDANIKGGSIVADNADAISGRFRADLSTTAPYLPTLTTYTASGVTTYNSVIFTIDGTSNLSTGVDYYVAVRPTALTSGFKVYLNGNLVKSFTSIQVPELVRNKVYNLGTLSIPAQPAEKVLNFDFTVEPPTGGAAAWPTNVTKDNGSFGHVDGGIERVYSLYGTDYTFVLADCGQATNEVAVVFYHTTTYSLVFNASRRYVGFPVIAGYKLTEVKCFNKSGSTTAKFEIVNRIMGNTSDNPSGSDIVAAAQTWATKSSWYTYTPSGTDSSTRYYLYCMSKGSVGTIILTYVPD